MSGDQVAKSRVQYCPLCGLLAAPSLKGAWVNCYHCELQFKVYSSNSRYCTENDGETKVESCDNKMKHATLEIAYRNFIEIYHRQRHEHSELTIYECDFCHFYHLGHAKQKTAYNRTYLKAEVERILGIGIEAPLAQEMG